MLSAFSIDELAFGFGLLSIAVFLVIFVFRGLSRFFRGPDRAREEHAAASVASAGASAPKRSFAQSAKAWLKRRLELAYAFVDAGLAAIGVAGLILTILNWTSLWRVLWIPQVGSLDLNRLVFPDLNGRWTGVILSNGRLQGYEDTGKPLSHEDCVKWFGAYEEKTFVCLPIEYDISMSLFSV